MSVVYFGDHNDHNVIIKRPESMETLFGSGRHSPDGFNWGFGGSGPAELAFCLLREQLGYEPKEKLYQLFKAEVIAVIPKDEPFCMTDEQIDMWVSMNIHRTVDTDPETMKWSEQT